MSFGDFLGMAGVGMSILGGISGYSSSKDMEKAAKELDFIHAAKLRDEIKALQEKI